MSKGIEVDWNKIQLAIFDVDGTLYNQSILRKKMSLMLMGHYLLRPWNMYDLQIIRVFRKERELMNFTPVNNIDDEQYAICARKVNVPVQQVKQVISKWMYQAPLPYLANCQFSGIKEFFQALRKRNIKIAIYSDYPAKEKLKAMGLKADLVVSSTDKEIDALKPSPSALTYITSKFGVPVEKCFFIGDRDELDGECARQAKMPYYILSEEDKKGNFYNELAASAAKN